MITFAKILFLLFLKLRIFHALTLTVDEWPFGIIATRNVRPTPGHSNPRIHCKQVDRTFKVRLPRRLRQPFPNY